jgi:hypothetical protein
LRPAHRGPRRHRGPGVDGSCGIDRVCRECSAGRSGRGDATAWLRCVPGTVASRGPGPVDAAAQQAFDAIAYTAAESREFESQVGGKYVNGVDIITCNDAGQIIEFKVMVRPLQAVTLVHQRMAAMLEQRKKS